MLVRGQTCASPLSQAASVTSPPSQGSCKFGVRRSLTSPCKGFLGQQWQWPLKTQFPFLMVKASPKKLGCWELLLLTAFLNKSSSFSAKSEAILETAVVARFT